MPYSDAQIDKLLEAQNKTIESTNNLNNGIKLLLGNKNNVNNTTKSDDLFSDIKSYFNPVGKVTDAIKKGFSIGISQTDSYLTDRVMDISNSLDVIKDIFSPVPGDSGILDLGNQILMQLEDENRLKTKINEQTGLTGKLSEDVRQSIVNSLPGTLQMGYGIEKVSDFFTSMIEKSGRFNIINSEVLVRTAQVSRAFVGDITKMADIMDGFEKIGVGSSDTLEHLNIIGVKSLELGLRSKKTIDDVNSNIEKLNQYGFKNGIEGLAEMSRKATEFRMNMENVFSIAEKVFDPEGAFKLSAELSVIGGTLGDFNDPLKLMYMATNNVEGLQDALIKAAMGLATYNVEQGRFEVTGVNLRKAKAMADELGVSVSDLSKTAIAASERTQAATALMSTGLQMSDEDREFITNMSQMEKGEMVIKIPESLAKTIGSPMTVQLSQMTDSLKNELIENKNAFANLDSKDIAMQQLTLQEQINRNVMAIAAVAKVRISQMLKEIPKGQVEDSAILLAGKFGEKVEDFMKVDQKTGTLSLWEGAENLIERVKGKIGQVGGVSDASEMIKNFLDKNKEEQKQKEQKMTVENKFTFNASPSLLDSLGRHIARSPQTWEDIYGAHHESVKSFTYGGRGF